MRWCECEWFTGQGCEVWTYTTVEPPEMAPESFVNGPISQRDVGMPIGLSRGPRARSGAGQVPRLGCIMHHGSGAWILVLGPTVVDGSAPITGCERCPRPRGPCQEFGPRAR